MSKELTTKSHYTQEQLTLITNTVAKGASADELKLFLYTANKAGLDPLTKQIHFIKRGGSGTVQAGIDGLRAIAERSKTLAGIDDAIYDNETGKHPNKASVTVYRIVNGERVPFTASARWTEYYPGEKLGFMWNKMPFLMLGKCAESLALRKAFPNDLSGIYSSEEMQQADSTDVGPRQQKYEDGVINREDIEAYCSVCSERLVNGKYGLYCPNKNEDGHKDIKGHKTYSAISKEDMEKKKQDEHDIIDGIIVEEEKEPF